MSRLKSLYLTGSRLFLGIIFFSAGMSKLMPFPGIIGPQWLEQELAPHGLALFARFIAMSQIFVGILLLSKRYATLGAVMLFPLLLGIFIVTVSLQWQGTPYVNAFLLLLNISLLAADYHRLKFLLFGSVSEIKNINIKPLNLYVDFIWLSAIAIFFIGLLTVNITSAHKIFLIIGGLTFALMIIWEAAKQLRTKNR